MEEIRTIPFIYSLIEDWGDGAPEIVETDSLVRTWLVPVVVACNLEIIIRILLRVLKGPASWVVGT